MEYINLFLNDLFYSIIIVANPSLCPKPFLKSALLIFSSLFSFCPFLLLFFLLHLLFIISIYLFFYFLYVSFEMLNTSIFLNNPSYLRRFISEDIKNFGVDICKSPKECIPLSSIMLQFEILRVIYQASFCHRVHFDKCFHFMHIIGHMDCSLKYRLLNSFCLNRLDLLLHHLLMSVSFAKEIFEECTQHVFHILEMNPFCLYLIDCRLSLILKLTKLNSTL